MDACVVPTGGTNVHVDRGRKYRRYDIPSGIVCKSHQGTKMSSRERPAKTKRHCRGHLAPVASGILQYWNSLRGGGRRDAGVNYDLSRASEPELLWDCRDSKLWRHGFKGLGACGLALLPDVSS